MACMDLLGIILGARNRHFFLFVVAFAFLLVCSLTPFQIMAQGNDEEVVVGVKMRSAIGSRPPRCDERCKNCGKCEAIQVPIKFLNEEIPTNRVEYSRGDDVSSYKPMCWKCKCGDFFFNP